MFITKDDLLMAIRQEELEALTEGDDALIEHSISVAISEVRSYLSARYDTDNVFNASGANRNPLILRFCVDISIYELAAIAQPGIDLADRRARKDRAIEWLKGVQKEQINPDLPVEANEDGTDPKISIQAGSNTKRNLHY